MNKIKKVLIANRGEIALRIIRTCRELGIATVVVHSTADANSLPVMYADESICIGPADIQDSYLNMHSILSAAEMFNVDAIHPGYGFLSENPDFVRACNASKFEFIGPGAELIELMGDKSRAKILMKENNVPVIDGSSGPITKEEGKAIAKRIGYPVLLKASAGGGGRGMRIVENENDFDSQYNLAKIEANKSFDNDDIYLEKFIKNPRHIEVQVACDKYGKVIILGTRDCSVQRRHQKLIEEAPALISKQAEQKLFDCVKEVLEKIKYFSVGTIEFLFDEDENFYFMEMNTRLQVEHPVTEQVTGLDLVKMQIQIADEQKLNISRDEIKINGHSIEVRITAEDYENNFMPNTGKIEVYHPSGGIGIRIDSHIHSEYEITPYYDSLLAKLVVWDKNRALATKRLQRALLEFVILGVKTTLPFYIRICQTEEFRRGRLNTNFINNIFEKK